MGDVKRRDWLRRSHLAKISPQIWTCNVSELRKDIIHFKLMKRKGRPPTYEAIIGAFSIIPSTSPLCRLYIDQHIDRWKTSMDESCGVELMLRKCLPVEFMEPVTVGISEKFEKLQNKDTSSASSSGATQVEDVDAKGVCAYHEHGQDVASIEACREARMNKRKRIQKELDEAA